MAAKRRVRRDLARIRGSLNIGHAQTVLGRNAGIAAAMATAADNELGLAGNPREGSGVGERIQTRLVDIEASASRRIRRGVGFIATVGATAPFIGLFGTVWGIMNSFIGISKSQTTNLAVVAPGIAEALMATALGLVAAIPAVILYNQLGQSIAHFRGLVRETSSEVTRVVSRQLDRDVDGTGVRVAAE
jgi:biopolymer transport protein ExbB